MDNIISSIIPTQRIGNDGFNWWVGQVEGTASDEVNNKGGYRCKVRIVGDHPGDPELVSTADLPWATMMMPVNIPYIPGNSGGGHHQLEIGCWVIGFYLDTEKQKPIIMGSIGMTPGATKVFVERTPETPPFTTAIPQINEADAGSPIQKAAGTGTTQNYGQTSGASDTGKNTGTGGLPDGTCDGDGNPRVNVPARKVIGEEDEDWCQSVAEKCSNQDINAKMTTIIGEFLYEVQRNNGNIGTYLVSPATGAINDGIDIARKYIGKANLVISSFVARVKGFIIEKLQNAVKDLIQATLFPSETGNILTPVTEFFNNMLKDLGCKMADLGERLAAWLTDVLMGLVNQIYRAVACQIDALVNGIMSQMNALMEEVLSSVLGPLQAILGAIAAPLNILGGAVNFVLDLLGISCSGPDQTCAKYKSVCTSGEKKEPDDGEDEDFLDNLLGDIDNLFPATGADYTQYVCDEAYTGNTLAVTTVGFTGGVPLPTVTSGTTTNADGTTVSGGPAITYDIQDIEVKEAQQGNFIVTRSGITDIASSVKYKTLVSKGTATAGVDYFELSGILGFAPGETSKKIPVTTLFDLESEGDEYFYIKLSRNSPELNYKTSFIRNIAKCTITEKDKKEPYNPYDPQPFNPETELQETFTDEAKTVIPTEGVPAPDPGVVGNTETYSVTADKSVVKEGEFVVYTITTENVPNGTILYYNLTGDGITEEDIIGGDLAGSFVINNNQGKVTVGLEEDGVVEEEETLRFVLTGIGNFVDVLVTAAEDNGDGPDDFGDLDEGEGETPENAPIEFKLPSVDPGKIITDPGGGIIDIPIDNPGSPWAEPPYIFIGGEGRGASATPLLDENGFITEIRVKTSGFGYRLNTAESANVRCIIDTFTLIRPGNGYTDAPTIYVDGRDDVAEAVINDDGLVIGGRVIDRTRTYDTFPEIIIVGGGGFGAKLLPSMRCLDTIALTTIGSTKIGTGRYVDCP